MPLPRRFLPVLALLLAPSLSAQRPWTWGMTAGPSFQSEDRWDRLSHLGPSIQGYAERRLTGRLAGRAELHVFYYGLINPPDYITLPCNAVCANSASTGPESTVPLAASGGGGAAEAGERSRELNSRSLGPAGAAAGEEGEAK